MTYGIEKELAKKIYKNYLQSDYLFFLKKNPSYLLRNVINETNQFALGIIGTIIILFTEIILITFLIILALITNALFTIIFFLFFFLLDCVSIFLQEKNLLNMVKLD